MSRPWVLVFLLLLVVFTSQFEWKQQFVNELEDSPSTSQKELYVSKREELVKEKIILSQEKNIQKLNDLVKNLHKELEQCNGGKEVVNDSANTLSEILSELNQHPILEN